MNAPQLMTFNAGSSTVKIGLFSLSDGLALQVGSGTIDFRHVPLKLELTQPEGVIEITLTAQVSDDLHEVLDETLDWLSKHFSLDRLRAIGHRVVHGGDRLISPIAVDDQSLAAIAELIPLAPLHQPQSLRLIKAIQHLRPHLLQTASFDTAFHQNQADHVRAFALPGKWFDIGIKRYGFHGLSYQSITKKISVEFPRLSDGKIVIAHLGSGASVCGVDQGMSCDTSMGFSTLDGIPMATRCGMLDPGVILYFLQHEKMQAKEIQHMLYEQSGLLGISGISADTRELQESTLTRARLAIDIFTFRIAGEIARIATTLGGMQTLVFTAGIGEHQPYIREAVCKRLEWLGVRIDNTANNFAAETSRIISQPDSRVSVMVIPTNEEQIIADESAAIVKQRALK